MSNLKERISDGKVFDWGKVISSVYDETGNALRVTVGGAAFLAYESGQVSPGANGSGYDVKNTGGLFSSVPLSFNTTLKNLDSAETITIYLNTDNVNPVTVASGESLNIQGFAVTNVFIDTTGSQSGAVEVTLFG